MPVSSSASVSFGVRIEIFLSSESGSFCAGAGFKMTVAPFASAKFGRGLHGFKRRFQLHDHGMCSRERGLGFFHIGRRKLAVRAAADADAVLAVLGDENQRHAGRRICRAAHDRH